MKFQLSSDSQYEFSYYNNRKDSTSTGRLSFSSENATKSTSSSFVSSGIWTNGSNKTTIGKCINTQRELVLCTNQYKQLIKLATPISTEYKTLWTTDVSSEYEQRTIILPLSKMELNQILQEKHNAVTPEEYLTVNKCLTDNETVGIDLEPNNLFVVYIFTIVDLFARNFETKWKHYGQLEAYLSVDRSHTNDTELQTYCTVMDLIEINIAICSDCIQHYLINKLMSLVELGDNPLLLKHLTTIDKVNMHQRRLLLKCLIRLTDNELEQINEDVSKVDELKLKVNKIKKLSNSHEKILNFFQLLLPKSAKIQKTKQNPCHGNQRRSSSAFVLGEDIDHVYDNRELCIKSCSQLQVISGGDSSEHSKSSSIQDGRCRSVISDVIITVNSGVDVDYVPKMAKQQQQQQPINITDNLISNSLPNDGLKACNQLDVKCHSYEYISTNT